MSDYGLHIFAPHAELLKASAIDPAVARERGYVSVGEKTRLLSAGFAKTTIKALSVPGLLIPVHGTDGEVRLHQYRPDVPRVDGNGRDRKYETPYKAKLVLDVPPRIREQLTDPAVDLYLTEGSRKADAGVTAGLCCISLLGVDGWLTNGVPLPDWRDVRLKGRRVLITFDSDVMTKESVDAALRRFSDWLAHRQAIVRLVILPHGEDGSKTGLDDFLAAGHDVGELRELGRAPGTPRKTAHTRTPQPDQPEQVCAPDAVCAHTPLLAATEDLLGAAVEIVHKLGVTGEERIIKGTFLTALSQVLAEPVSLVVKGSSAGGKSYSTRTTLRLVPGEESGPPLCTDPPLYTVTAGSQRSLIYTDQEFSHRTIVMFEATALREVAETRDGDMTAMLVRTLLSEGQIIYDVAEIVNGKTVTRRITKKGPTNLIVTTTADNLHHENETRLLSLTVDESEEQTRAIMRKIALRRNQPVPAEPPDLTEWHALFHWLKHHGKHSVYVPYAGYLSDTATAAVVRMRRDFGVLIGMIEAHAILHQVTRKRDEHARIVATDADYQAAKDILAEAFAVSSGRKVKANVRRTVTAVAELGGQASDVLVAQVARHLKRDRTRVTRGLKEATDLGYLTNREDKAGRPHRYRLGPDALPEDTAALPEELPDEVCGRTPAQAAHLSPQVSDGCAGVRGVQGGTPAQLESAIAELAADPDVAVMADLSDHDFESALAQARADGDMSRASVAEKARAIIAPVPGLQTRPNSPGVEYINGWPAGSVGAEVNSPGGAA